MGANVSGQVAKLRTLTRQELLDIWRRIYRKAAPEGIRRELLVPFLAYRMQEEAYGGLKPSTLSELRRIARTLENAVGPNERRMRAKIKSGTRFIRRWHGETHEVSVSESGYEYRGAKYKSLSRIASNITGTRWSGPAFFGLNGSKPVRGRNND
jgi:hypothetical protein